MNAGRQEVAGDPVGLVLDHLVREHRHAHHGQVDLVEGRGRRLEERVVLELLVRVDRDRHLVTDVEALDLVGELAHHHLADLVRIRHPPVDDPHPVLGEELPVDAPHRLPTGVVEDGLPLGVEDGQVEGHPGAGPLDLREVVEDRGILRLV